MTATGAIRACLFDAYGTLLDFGSVARHCASQLSGKADPVTATWRAKQLEYAWVSSLCGEYQDFWRCTGAALEFALQMHGLPPALADRLLEGYRMVDPFGDAAPALRMLRRSGIRTGILSNGTPAMLSAALGSAGLAELVDDCFSVEAVRAYKPSMTAYGHAAAALAVEPGMVAFVSANAWDVAGARRAGFSPVWINRHAGPDEYGLRGGCARSRLSAGSGAYSRGALRQKKRCAVRNSNRTAFLSVLECQDGWIRSVLCRGPHP